MNNVTLIGNLTRDPELREFDSTDKNGNAVKKCSFKLAVNRPGKDAGADFIWVGVWNGSAQPCMDFLSKGSRVAVEGSIRTNYDAEKEKDYIEVTARPGGVTFLNTSKDGAGSTLPPEAQIAAPSDEAPEVKSDDDIPF